MKPIAPLLAFGLIGVVAAAPATAKMVYLHQEGEDRRVALARDDGTFERFLTPKSRHAYHPEFSADGRYVAYSLGTIKPEEEVSVAIHVQRLGSREVEVWTPEGNQYIHAEISGGGGLLAFSGPVEGPSGETVQNIFLVDLAEERNQGPDRVETKDGVTYQYYTPELERIPSEHDCFFPALASDGSFVIYHRTLDASNKKSPKEIVRYDRREGTKERLTAKNGHAMAPSLSYDNRYVAYTGITDGQWDIHIIDLAKDTSRRLTESKQREFTPVYAPDGAIYYSHLKEDGIDIYEIPPAQVEGKAPVRPAPFLADPAVLEYIPSFSGDLNFELARLPDLPDPARSSFGAVAHRGKIYIAGGHHGPQHTYPESSFLSRLDIHDPDMGTWTEAAPMSVPRQGFDLVGYKRFIYAFGGFAYAEENEPHWRSLDIIERYDTETGKWTVLPVRLPRPRSSNVAVRVGTRVYLIGGWDSTPDHKGDKEGEFHREIDVFDLESESVSTAPFTLPDPLRRAFTGTVYKDEIYVLGGISVGAEHFDWVDNVTVLDPRSGKWRSLPPLPFETFAPGTGVLADRLFFFGGMNKMSGYVNTIYSLDLKAPERWRNTGRYLSENKGFPIIVNHPAGGLGVLGGHTYEHTDEGIVDRPVATFEWLK